MKQLMQIDKPSDQNIRNATKMAIVLLIHGNEYIKFVYRCMLAINRVAKIYNIKLPEVLTEDCHELKEYNDTYQLLCRNGKLNPTVIGDVNKFVDIDRFRYVYQPIYNRALVVCDKYPMVYRAVMSGLLNLRLFTENKLTVLEYSARNHYLKSHELLNGQLVILYSDPKSMLELYDYEVPTSPVSPILKRLPGEYFAEYYNQETGTITYTGKIYFEMYPERLFEYMWELPDIYDSMCSYQYGIDGSYDMYRYNGDYESKSIDDFDIDSMLSD
jgi:hypothetical protein